MIVAACGGLSDADKAATAVIPTATAQAQATATAEAEATATAIATPPDPVAIYQAMGARMASVTSFHLSGTAGDEGQTEQFEIDFVAPDRVMFTATGEEGTSVFINIGGQLYARFPDFQGWFTFPEDPIQFAAFFSAVFTKASDLTYVAQETMQGAAAHHVQGTLGGDVLRLVDPEDEDDRAIADFWIGVDDSLLHRFFIEESPSGEITDAFASQFDTPLTIEAPTNPVSITVLDALFEGGEIDPQALSALVAILPLEGQECLRNELGEGTYNDLLAGTGSLGVEEGPVFRECLGAFFGPPPIDVEAGRSFFASLPDDVKAELEAAGWTEERIIAELELEGDEDTPIEEFRGLFGPLSDIPIPFVAEGATFIINQIPVTFLGPLIEEIGQDAFDELKAGSRPPTGGEFLAIIETISVLESLGQ